MLFATWRNAGIKERVRNLDYVRKYTNNTLGLWCHEADSPFPKFSLSAARNNAVAQAKAAGASVVVIQDADVLIDPQALVDAVALAREGKIVLPYDLVRYLIPYHTNLILRGKIKPQNAQDLGAFDWSLGGAYVTTVETWEYVGGQDERFAGWGCEDIAFAVTADKMGKRLERTHGTMHHLFHPSAEKETDPSYYENSALLTRYETEDPQILMREWKS